MTNPLNELQGSLPPMVVDTIHRERADQRQDAEFDALEAKYKEIIASLEADVARSKHENEQLMSSVKQLRTNLSPLQEKSKALDAREAATDQLKSALEQEEARLAYEKGRNPVLEMRHQWRVEAARQAEWFRLHPVTVAEPGNSK